jgi:uncharacterized protein with HEPN domain
MSTHDPKLTLSQLREFAQNAHELAMEFSLQDIISNWQRRLAFERIMEVLGEAVKRLPRDLTSKYPDVDWQAIAGMRDRLSHGYDAVDHEVLWRSARDRVPGLLNCIERMLLDLEKSS